MVVNRELTEEVIYLLLLLLSRRECRRHLGTWWTGDPMCWRRRVNNSTSRLCPWSWWRVSFLASAAEGATCTRNGEPGIWSSLNFTVATYSPAEKHDDRQTEWHIRPQTNRHSDRDTENNNQ